MKTIATAKEYFEQVLAYNMQQYKAQPTSLPAAYNLANSLFSMHEWIWHTYSSTLGDVLDTDFKKVGKFCTYVQTSSQAFKHMRDLANASKQVVLNGTPSTQTTKITDTAAITSGYGEAVYGISKYGRGVIVIDDGGTKVDFENTANEAHKYWKNLLLSLGA